MGDQNRGGRPQSAIANASKMYQYNQSNFS